MSTPVLDHAKIEKVDGITVEYRLAPKMIIFSHGFGVRRDSRGMFTDVTAQLPASWGYVLFEYSEDEHGMVRVTDSTDQVMRLRKVVGWLSAQAGVRSVGIVGHSRGCVIAAMASVEGMSGVILLAPPLEVGHAREYFTHKPGAYREGKDWFVPRSDGSVTIMPDSVFDDFESINREKVILDYAAVQPLWVVGAGADNVLEGQDFRRLAADPHITFRKVDGANHDFVGEARQKMIDYIFEALAVA